MYFVFQATYNSDMNEYYCERVNEKPFTTEEQAKEFMEKNKHIGDLYLADRAGYPHNRTITNAIINRLNEIALEAWENGYRADNEDGNEIKTLAAMFVFEKLSLATRYYLDCRAAFEFDSEDIKAAEIWLSITGINVGQWA